MFECEAEPVHLSGPFEDLPQFPELPQGELHILQPAPLQGRTFVEVASYPTPEFLTYTVQVMQMALHKKQNCTGFDTY